MKKLLIVFLILTFCSVNIPLKAQDSEAGANIILGLIEDDLIKEGAQELSEITRDLANAAKQSGQQKNVGPFVRSIKRNADAYVKASQLLLPERCGKVFNKKNVDLQGIIAKNNKLQERLCSKVNSTTPSRVFHPLASHCKSPFDVKCVCGHHPERPECSSLGMSGNGMSGGGMSEGETSEGSGSESKPPCLTDEEFAAILEGVGEGLLSLSDAITRDSNGNGLPDACENNPKDE